MITLEVGQEAEERALDYLKKHGMKRVAQNYRCRFGEIDIIMRDGIYLVFIEVRARTHTAFGGGLGSITYAKRQKIVKTTAHYLLTNKLYEQYPIRFDAVSIDGISGKIIWVKDAFSTDT